MSPDEVVELMAHVARELAGIHAGGRVHGAISPATVMKSDSVERPRALAYAAPEETEGGRAPDGRADLYALGATAFHLLTGRPPFPERDPLELRHARLTRVPEPIARLRGDVPEALSAIVAKLLAKQPDERYQSAEGLLADLSLLGSGPFSLGAKDHPASFTVPDVLYGRDEERAALNAALDRARGGAVVAVLLAGAPGAGKTRLAAELAQAGGVFASASFDRRGRGGPHTLGAALREPIRLLLGEPGVAAFEERLREVPGAELLREWIPELRHVAGWTPAERAAVPSPPDVTLGAVLDLLAVRSKPLVVFLDDLQWADGGSLALIARAFGNPDREGLLLVGACREGDPDARSPAEVRAALEEHGLPVDVVPVAPLAPEAVTALLTAATRAPEEECQALAAVLRAKTGGNPLFIRELLALLERDRLLAWTAGAWRWDLRAVSGVSVSDNVVDLLLGEMRALPRETVDLLRTAACLGRRFARTDLDTAAGPLARALESHVVVEERDGMLAFAHDRFQEAAYALIAPEDRPALHAEIGRRLLAASAEPEADPRVPEIVSQLARGLGLLAAGERRVLAKLALVVGRRAASTAAFESAWTSFEHGLDALAGRDPYDLWLSLSTGAADAALAAGRIEAMERRAAEVRAHAASLADEVPVWVALVRSRMVAGRLAEAIALAGTFLSRAGRPYPTKAGRVRLLAAYARTRLAIGGRTPEDLLLLPEARDPLARGVQKVQTLVATAVLAARPELIPFSILADVRAVLRDGVTPSGAQCWTGYALLLIRGRGDVALAQRFGDLALQQIERLGGRELWPRIAWFVYGLVRPWTVPLRDLIEPLREVGARGLEVGDAYFGLMARFTADQCAFFSGAELRPLATQLERTASLIAHHREDWIEALHRPLRDAVRVLLSPQGRLQELSSEASPDAAMGFLASVRDLAMALVMGDHARALRVALEPPGHDVARAPRTGAHMVYCTYAGVALHEGVARGLATRREVSSRVRRARSELRAWVRDVPDRAWRLEWVAAAELRARGRPREALEIHDRALDGALRAGAFQDAGMIAEHAATAAAALGRWRHADGYRKEALSAYRRWGAAAKVAALTGADEPSDPADLRSVLRSSQALAEEVVYAAVLDKVMATLLANAGATRGALVLGDAEEAAVAAAAGIEGAQSLDALPVSLVRYVLRSGDAVVLADAAREGAWQRDPYLSRRRPRSVLCAPVLRGGRVRGAVYLENDLLAGCFTEDRLETVRLLASQAAISIENAALVDGLEAKVRERTAELVVAREKAEVASRAKSDFLAQMSHELRTPLNAVLGYAEILLRRDDLSKAQHEGVATIRRSGAHLLGLIDDLLDLAKIEAGTFELREGLLSVASVLDGVRELVAVQAAGKGIAVEVVVEPEVASRVRGDERRLRQVLLNLAGNAVKFSGQGVVRLSARAREGGVRFEVSDQGPGIAQGDLARIFEPFEQAGDARSRARGAGLGLAISRKLARLMGGEVTVESAPGAGSTFTVDLPLAAAGGPSADDRLALAPITGHVGPRRRLLVADDDASSRALLRDVLEPLGFEVELAEDGARAIEIGRARRPDLVLTDRAMPRADGAEVARALAGVPVVQVSSSVSGPPEPGLFAAHLTKPIDVDALLGTLERLLGLTWLREDAAAAPIPREDLAALIDASLAGHMRAVAERARSMARNPELRALASRIERLAGDFDDAGLLRLFERVRILSTDDNDTSAQ